MIHENSEKTVTSTTEDSELDKWDQEDLTAKLELSLISPNELKRIENWKTSNTKINCHTDFCSCITDLLRNGAKFKGNGGDS